MVLWKGEGCGRKKKRGWKCRQYYTSGRYWKGAARYGNFGFMVYPNFVDSTSLIRPVVSYVSATPPWLSYGKRGKTERRSVDGSVDCVIFSVFLAVLWEQIGYMIYLSSSGGRLINGLRRISCKAFDVWVFELFPNMVTRFYIVWIFNRQNDWIVNCQVRGLENGGQGIWS